MDIKMIAKLISLVSISILASLATQAAAPTTGSQEVTVWTGNSGSVKFLVDNGYGLIRFLGKGDRYVAAFTAPDQMRVAVKKVDVKDESFLAIIAWEIFMLDRLDHQNVLKLRHIMGIPEEVLVSGQFREICLVTDLLDRDLATHLESNRSLKN